MVLAVLWPLGYLEFQEYLGYRHYLVVLVDLFAPSYLGYLPDL